MERVQVICQDYGGFRHSYWILFQDYDPLRYSTIMSMINSLCCSIKYQPLNDNNSEEFQASFVLEFCKPLPAAVEIVQKIHEVINKTGTNSVEILNEVYIIYRFGQA